MNIPSPASTPFQSLQRDGSLSPAEFHQRLLHVINVDLAEGARIKANQNEAWAVLTRELSDYLFTDFPTNALESPWGEIGETVMLVERALDLMNQLFKRTNGLFDGRANIALSVTTNIICLCSVLDRRGEDYVPETLNLPTPIMLRAKAFSMAVTLLAHVGEHLSSSRSESTPGWESVHSYLRCLLKVYKEINSHFYTIPYPATVSFQHIPYIRAKPTQCDTKPSPPNDLVLGEPRNAIDLVCLITDLIVSVLISIKNVAFLVDDLAEGVTDVARTSFDFLLSGQWSTTPNQTTKCASKLLACMRTLTSSDTYPILVGICAQMAFQLLYFRISTPPRHRRDVIDQVLLPAPHIQPDALGTSNCLSIVRILNQIDKDDATIAEIATAYILPFIPYLDAGALCWIRNNIRSSANTHLEKVTTAVQQEELKRPSNCPGRIAMDVDGQAQTQVERLLPCIQLLVHANHDSLTDDLSSLRGDDLAAHVFWLVQSGFPSSLTDIPVQKLQCMLDALIKLPCLVLLCSGTECVRLEQAGGAKIIEVYATILPRFLDENTNSACRKRVFSALACASRHHPLQATNDQAFVTDLMAKQALADKDRGVRLAAGRTIVENVRIYNSIGKPAWKHVEECFDMFASLLDSGHEPAKETALVTVAAIAKNTSSEILGIAVSCLISQLANANPVLSGLAFTELLSIAAHFKKSPYRILSPYMEDISIYLVLRWCSQPSMLIEFCRLISWSLDAFLSVNLPHTLPPLFASQDRRVLDKLSHDLGIKSSTLFVKHCEPILAYILMLPGKERTNRAFDFLLRTIQPETSAQQPLDIQTIIQSCVVQLLALLVINLGGDNPDQAIEALHKVRDILPDKRKSKAKTESKVDLRGFLKTRILGVVSEVLDMLQGPRGKKTIEAKRRILRCLGKIADILKSDISIVAPQIMSTFQLQLAIPELSDTTLDSWLVFLTRLSAEDVGPYIGMISVSMITNWAKLSRYGRQVAYNCFYHLVITRGQELEGYLDDFADVGIAGTSSDVYKKLAARRRTNRTEARVQILLNRASSDSIPVVSLALHELNDYMIARREWFQTLATGDTFTPIAGRILNVLLSAATRNGEGADELRLVAYECIGALGAIDPDRFDLGASDRHLVVVRNFTDDEENVEFVTHLISDVLVGAFRSTGVIQHQRYLAYAMQELLKFCGFTSALVSQSHPSVTLRVRKGWERLPKHTHDVVTPLLDSTFIASSNDHITHLRPFYPHLETYREWLPTWAGYLITRVSGTAAKIFEVLESCIVAQDVSVAYRLLPHLILHVLLSGAQTDVEDIRAEILCVLEDQMNDQSSSSKDKRVLSTQVIFMLMDHVNRWIRLARQEIGPKRLEGRRSRGLTFGESEDQLTRIDSILSSIDQRLIANVAFQCKAYARSLMSFERHVSALRCQDAPVDELQNCYDHIHKIYASLDEPDGMTGVSTLIILPSLEHQIREHESNGQWTSAQSCWELSLQQSPNNLECHKGLLNCLRQLGHYDTLRTHVKGLLSRNPSWKEDLIDFDIEGAWMVGDWNEVQALADSSPPESSRVSVAKVLLSIRSGNDDELQCALSQARAILGAPISATGAREYRRCYEAVLNLHILHELMILPAATATCRSRPGSASNVATNLSRSLRVRLESTQPSYRIREPILSMRRTALMICSSQGLSLQGEVGRCWLTSAKLARKAGFNSTAYSALLQAQHHQTPYAFVQAAKLSRARGEDARALETLENSVKHFDTNGAPDTTDVIDLTGDEEDKLSKAKALLLYCRWMNEADNFDEKDVHQAYTKATNVLPKFESANFYYGKFQDESYKSLTSDSERKGRGSKMLVVAVRCFMKSIRYGSKFTYQTVPRTLMIWLDMGEDPKLSRSENFKKVCSEVERTIPDIPAYKWYTAFPQIASRVGHGNEKVWEELSKIIMTVIREYPLQAMWQFASVLKSKNSVRRVRGQHVLRQLIAQPSDDGAELKHIIDESISMVNELLRVCDNPIKDDRRILSMKKDFPGLSGLAPSRLIIPLQESLVASLPSHSSADSDFKPFPVDCPRFQRFHDEVEVMRTLAKPRKITLIGDNAQIYMFLGKPKDDLRKDARLMDFNSIINKLLKANSDSRRRQLHIRTYSVVPLNEECGFIQWVPRTTPIRPVLLKSYEARNIASWGGEMGALFELIKTSAEKEAGKIFLKKVLPMFPPVFHEWFLGTFPEPSAWLASRLTYSRTAAVMSMVGFILGLGDRHCENILLDEVTGAIVHVDFNCLFEKGKTLETPERVPFRLTQNIVDGLGITGVEGVFRAACVITMQILRDNRDTLMAVLAAFIHDPLVEWEDEKKRMERDAAKRGGNASRQVDMRQLARNALDPIQKKLSGIYVSEIEGQSKEREISTNSLVQALIQEATDECNLGKMYPGWAPWH